LRLKRKTSPFIAWSVELDISLYDKLHTSRSQTDTWST